MQTVRILYIPNMYHISLHNARTTGWKENSKIIKQQATLSIYVRLSDGLFKDEKDLENAVKKILKPSARFCTCHFSKQEAGMVLDLQNMDDPERYTLELLKQLQEEDDVLGPGCHVQHVSRVTPLPFTIRYSMEKKAEAKAKEFKIELSAVADFLKQQGFNVVKIDEIHEPVENVTCVIGRARGKLSKALFESYVSVFENINRE